METYRDRLQDAFLMQMRVELTERDIAQQDLAAKMGIDKATLNRYLKGRTAITMPTFFRMAEALDLTPMELLERAGRRVEHPARPASASS